MRAGLERRFGWLLAASARPRRPDPDRSSAQALVAAGLAAATALPILLLVSLQLEMAVAAPTVLAAGYLVIAQSLIGRGGRHAGIWSVVLFGGLAAWTVYVCGFQSTPTWPHAALALIGPLFAAAPSLALRALSPVPPAVQPTGAAGANDDVREPTIHLDGEGRIIAASQAVRCLFGSAEIAEGMDVASLAPLFERPALLAALHGVRDGGERRFSWAGDHFAGPVEVCLRAVPGGGFVLHIRRGAAEAAATAPRQQRIGVGAPLSDPSCRPACDLTDAIAAACCKVSVRAEARRVRLINRATGPALAGVERVSCRNVVAAFLAAAAEQSAKEGDVEISCRRQRGAIVVRAAGSSAAGDTACPTVHAAAKDADALGGSVLFGREAGEAFALELRLPAPHGATQLRQELAQ